MQLRSPGWLIGLGLAALWFAAASIYPLIEPDEARYAEIPREMAASGDWVTPRLDGLQYFEKPPLQYWATAALYKVFGVREWTARTWPLGLAFLCLPLTFVWVRRRHGAAAGFAALSLLAASPFFTIMGHLNLLDAGLTFWLTATVFAFAFAQDSPAGSKAERNSMLVAWIAAALAVLSKGIVVPVLAGLTLIGYSLIYRDWRPWRRLHLLAGLPLFLLIAVPWFIAVSVRNPGFARFFFLHEHFERFLTTVHRHGEPWWFFLPIAALATLPWLATLPGALQRAARASPAESGFHSSGFLLVYCGVVLGFFSLSQSKLAPYILPMMPPLAALAGIHIGASGSPLRRAGWIAAAGVTLTAAGLVVYALHRYDAAPPSLLLWVSLALLAAMIAALNITPRAAPPRNALWLAAGSILAWQCLMVAHGTPPLERSARSLVAAVRPQIIPHTVLYHVGQYRQSVPVYLQRTVTLVGYQGELEFGQGQEPGVNATTLEQFKTRWRADTDAVAFFEPAIWSTLTREGFPGRVIGADRYSQVVSRR